MINRIITFLAISLLTLILVLMTIYIINPYDIKSDNIRPRIFGVDIYRIPSKSMMPLLSPGDLLIASNRAYKTQKPNKGDIIIFKHQQHTKPMLFIKRIVAIEGDSVLLQEGKLFVNKTPVEELYINPKNKVSDYSLNMKKMTVPDDHYFVLGDNRDNSTDSRLFGTVVSTEIIGKATNILYSKNHEPGTKIK